MTAAITERTYRLGEFHDYEAGGSRFLYLVPAGAIFELDSAAAALIDRLKQGEADHDDLVASIVEQGISRTDAEELVVEMFH